MDANIIYSSMGKQAPLSGLTFFRPVGLEILGGQKMTFSKNETCWETIRIYQVIFATCAKERSNFPDITLKDPPLCINRPHISIAEETLCFPLSLLSSEK